MSGHLIYGQLSYSTADIERGQFAGELEPLKSVTYLYAALLPIPAGEYRVIDGELFQVIDEARPAAVHESQRLEPEATS